MRSHGSIWVLAVTLVGGAAGCGGVGTPQAATLQAGFKTSALSVRCGPQEVAVGQVVTDQGATRVACDQATGQVLTEKVGPVPGDQTAGQVPGDQPAEVTGDQPAGQVGDDSGAQARRPSRPPPRPPVTRPDRPDRDAPRGPRGPIVIVPGLPVIGVPALNPTVLIAGIQFRPAAITVPMGTMVTWVNRDAVGHTVTSPLPGLVQTIGAFDGEVPPGGTFVFTFNAPGQFGYFCRIHPEMRGTVTVVDPTAEAPAPAPEPPVATEPTEPATPSETVPTQAAPRQGPPPARTAPTQVVPAQTSAPSPRTGGIGY